MLKNKYNLTLCPSRLHTAFETFVDFLKLSIFCVYVSITNILIGKDDKYKNPWKNT